MLTKVEPSMCDFCLRI